MDDLLTMRTELWHPLIVHLPITTLLLASVAGLLKYVMRKPQRQQFLIDLTKLLLLLGVAGGWIGIYTGQLAYNVEVRNICDPKALQEHQWWSYFAIIDFSVALLLILLRKYLVRLDKLIDLVLAALYVGGLAALLYAGHLGAAVVYEQGAGVHKPQEDCSDYIVR